MPVYDFIKIRGCPGTPPDESPEYFEIFVGIGGGSFSTGDINVTAEGGDGGDDGDVILPPPTRTEISQNREIALAMWEAQGKLIARQSAYLDAVKKEVSTKWEDLPSKLKDRTIKEAAVEEFVKFLAGATATYFFGPMAGEIAKSGITLIAVAIRLLKALYNECEALCDAMKSENSALLTLERSLENYQMRSTLITQHDVTIQNLLSQIEQTERRIISETSPAVPQGNEEHASAILTEMSETLKMIQAEDNIVMCPHTGDCLYTKSLVTDDVEIDT